MERRYKSGRICFRPLLDSVQLTTCQQHLWLDRSYYSCVQVRVSCAIENEDDDVVFRVFRILLIGGTIVIYKDKYSGRYSYGGRKGGREVDRKRIQKCSTKFCFDKTDLSR